MNLNWSILRILNIRTNSFRGDSVYEQIHYVYSLYMNRSLQCVRWMRRNNFEYSEGESFSSQLWKGHYFEEQYVYLQLDLRLTKNKLLVHSSLAKKWIRIFFIIRGVIFEYGNAGGFEFIFEKNLGWDRWSRRVLLMKKREVENLVQVNL
jgi:hypothetical protein